jgi:hypothetical protein
MGGLSVEQASEKGSVYERGSFVKVDLSDWEGNWYYRLKVKSFKIRAWLREFGEYYWLMGYKFVPVCLTFKDWDAFIEFEKRGGRRAFMDHWKKVNKEGRIVDYVCVLEFQARGVPHFHFLVIVDGKVEFPDEVVSMYKGLGMSKVGKAFKVYKSAVRYLRSYLKKMSQLSYACYCELKESVRGIKSRVRVYEFGRRSKNGLFSALNKGWVRYLYVRLLKVCNWRWKCGWLEVAGLRIKAEWDAYVASKKLYLCFRRFLVERRIDEYVVGFEVAGLRDLEKGLGLMIM